MVTGCLTQHHRLARAWTGEYIVRLTLAFSCGARSEFALKEKDYLRSMLSRRQLEGFVILRHPISALKRNYRRSG
jgi:hypothetical protein